MAEKSERSGRYECDIVETLPKDLECSICLNVLREPNLNDCCGQHFCQACIQRIIDDNKPCPLCNEANFTVILDKKTQRKILELLVKCRRHQSGCEWVGELKSLEEHCGICEYVEVDCPNSCGETLQRRLHSYHLESECPKRHFVCTYCGHESTHGDITTEHWPTCEQFPISCKNLCGTQNIPRCKEVAHRLEDCPLQEVECKYKYVGCEEKVKRKDIDAHMEMEMKKHLELMERYAKKLEEKKVEDKLKLELHNQFTFHIFSEMIAANEKLKRNCVYSFNFPISNFYYYSSRCCNSGELSPLYGPGYRMQMVVTDNRNCAKESEELAVSVSVWGGHSDHMFEWPLKAIVTVEIVDESGRYPLESQSKMGVCQRPQYNQRENIVTFDPFVSRSDFINCSFIDPFFHIRVVKFNLYLCRPADLSISQQIQASQFALSNKTSNN